MSDSQGTQYYWSEDFSAAALSINGSGFMYLFLPDEGKTPEDEVNLVFDRPFLFIVKDYNIPLFAGIINNLG